MTKSSQDCLVVPHNSCHIGTLPLLISGNSKKNSVLLLLLFSSLFKNPHTHSHFLTHLPTHPKSRSKKRRYFFFPHRIGFFVIRRNSHGLRESQCGVVSVDRTTVFHSASRVVFFDSVRDSPSLVPDPRQGLQRRTRPNRCEYYLLQYYRLCLILLLLFGSVF